MSAFGIYTCIPDWITSGEAVQWTETPGDYPPASYAIVYKFAGQTPQDGYQTFSITGQESGDTYTFTTPTTPAPKPGVYQYERQITRSSDGVMRVCGTGLLTVRANLATAPTTTQAATLLAALDAAILALSTNPTTSVSFNGQSYSNSDLHMLYNMRTRLQAEVHRQNQAVLALSGKAANPFVETRFGHNYVSPYWPR